MSCSLGISTGSSGVYSALVDTDTSTNAPGAVPAETRFVSADQANSNVGDLVRASIKLMTTQVTDGSEAPRSIGVSYRTDDQLASIRSSLSRSPKQVRAIPEPAAVHAYLAETGKTERYDTTAQVDVGDQGLTVSVVDHTGEVLHSDRIDALAGAGIDRALVDFVTEKAPGHLRRYTDAELLAGPVPCRQRATVHVHQGDRRPSDRRDGDHARRVRGHHRPGYRARRHLHP